MPCLQKQKKIIHSPPRYARILDLLHKDPKLSFLFTAQANYTETQTASFRLEQLKRDNPTHSMWNQITSTSKTAILSKYMYLHCMEQKLGQM